jgi:uncharacterized DUF497 family protein
LEIVDGLLEFEWDPAKDASNLVKHGITFADAALCSMILIT